MRQKKYFLIPLALEALTEELSSKTTCLLAFAKQNQQIIKFKTCAEMLNILLSIAQVDCKCIK